MSCTSGKREDGIEIRGLVSAEDVVMTVHELIEYVARVPWQTQALDDPEYLAVRGKGLAALAEVVGEIGMWDACRAIALCAYDGCDAEELPPQHTADMQRRAQYAVCGVAPIYGPCAAADMLKHNIFLWICRHDMWNTIISIMEKASESDVMAGITESAKRGSARALAALFNTRPHRQVCGDDSFDMLVVGVIWSELFDAIEPDDTGVSVHSCMRVRAIRDIVAGIPVCGDVDAKVSRTAPLPEMFGNKTALSDVIALGEEHVLSWYSTAAHVMPDDISDCDCRVIWRALAMPRCTPRGVNLAHRFYVDAIRRGRASRDAACYVCMSACIRDDGGDAARIVLSYVCTTCPLEQRGEIVRKSFVAACIAKQFCAAFVACGFAPHMASVDAFRQCIAAAAANFAPADSAILIESLTRIVGKKQRIASADFGGAVAAAVRMVLSVRRVCATAASVSEDRFDDLQPLIFRVCSLCLEFASDGDIDDIDGDDTADYCSGAFCAACELDSPGMLDYLTRVSPQLLRRRDVARGALKVACRFGSIAAASWLVSNFGCITDSLRTNQDSIFGHLHVQHRLSHSTSTVSNSSSNSSSSSSSSSLYTSTLARPAKASDSANERGRKDVQNAGSSVATSLLFSAAGGGAGPGMLCWIERIAEIYKIEAEIRCMPELLTAELFCTACTSRSIETAQYVALHYGISRSLLERTGMLRTAVDLSLGVCGYSCCPEAVRTRAGSPWRIDLLVPALAAKRASLIVDKSIYHAKFACYIANLLELTAEDIIGANVLPAVADSPACIDMIGWLVASIPDLADVLGPADHRKHNVRTAHRDAILLAAASNCATTRHDFLRVVSALSSSDPDIVHNTELLARIAVMSKNPALSSFVFALFAPLAQQDVSAHPRPPSSADSPSASSSSSSSSSSESASSPSFGPPDPPEEAVLTPPRHVHSGCISCSFNSFMSEIEKPPALPPRDSDPDPTDEWDWRSAPTPPPRTPTGPLTPPPIGSSIPTPPVPSDSPPLVYPAPAESRGVPAVACGDAPTPFGICSPIQAPRDGTNRAARLRSPEHTPRALCSLDNMIVCAPLGAPSLSSLSCQSIFL